MGYIKITMFAILWNMPCRKPGYKLWLPNSRRRMYCEILQARILMWGAFPFSRDLLNPGMEPRSPEVDSLPSEPPGKPKNTGVGSLSLLQEIFRPRNWTGVSCIAGGFFTNWAITFTLNMNLSFHLNISIKLEEKKKESLDGEDSNKK